MKPIKKLEELGLPIKKFRKRPIVISAVKIDKEVHIETREGTLKGYPGDFIIKGVEGEIYPCGEEIFYKTYEVSPCPYCNDTGKVPEGMVLEPYWWKGQKLTGKEWAGTKFTTCNFCRSEDP